MSIAILMKYLPLYQTFSYLSDFRMVMIPIKTKGDSDLEKRRHRLENPARIITNNPCYDNFASNKTQRSVQQDV
ncbi:hypothetical protein [Virgibacillus ainsalahensis]